MNLQDLIINSTSTISQNKEENSITIFAGHSKEKLSNLIKDFPDNCYVNKQITGKFNRYFYQITDNRKAASSSCQGQDIKILTNQLLEDLPAYANRASQRARRLRRKSEFYSYVFVAGRPEFEPLTLGPGVYTPSQATDSQIQQIFFTTLERQYTAGKAIELQEFHWVFLTQTRSGWRLATMFSQTGGYPTKKPPTPPRESSDGVIAQGIEAWLRDCHARG